MRIYSNPKNGAKAVVAIVRIQRGIWPPEGPDDDGFYKIAEAHLIAKDEKGLAGEDAQKILHGNNIEGNFGLLINQIYGGRVTEISSRKFSKIEKYFTNDEKQKRENKHVRKTEDEEGAEETAERKFRRRCPGLVAEKKRNSDYRCEVCQMNFQEEYGDRGIEYIVVHHRDPIAMRSEPSNTTLDDLNIVCPNCHAMLHKGDLITVEQLRRIIRKDSG